jgi:hypothetical protein
MPVDQEQRFVALAERIVASDPNPTEESLEKQILALADGEDFSGEQIRRLSESVNQLMFNRVLTSEENKFDKTMSFPIVDPGAVIRRYYTEDKCASLTKVASKVSTKWLDFHTDPKSLLYSSHEKTASEPTESLGWEDAIKKDPFLDKLRNFELLKKASEALRMEMATCEFTILDAVDKLACMMIDPVGPNHPSFEKSAFLLYGKDSLPFLNMVRDQLNMPTIKGFSGSLEKVGHIILDDRKPEYGLIKQAIKSAKLHGRCEAKRAEISKSLKENGCA